MSKLKILAFEDDFEKVPSISYLAFSVGKEPYTMAVVLPSEDPSFDVEDRMLSLAVQIKMKIKSGNIDIKDTEAVAAIIKMVASRDTKFRVLPIKTLSNIHTDYFGLYKLDLNQVFIRVKSTGQTIIRKIDDPYRISSIIEGLLKLTKG